MYRLRGLAGLLLVAVACDFDASVPEGAQIGCRSDDDCPEGMTCRAALGRCVDAGADDVTAPALVGTPVIERSALGSGDVLRVAFEVSEALATPPTVELLVGTGRLALEEQPDCGEAPRRFCFVRTIDGTEPEGPAELQAALIDAFGNRAVGLRLGGVRLDFTPPSLLQSFLPTVARPGATFVVQAAASEAVGPGAALRARMQDGTEWSTPDSSEGTGLLTWLVALPAEAADGALGLSIDGLADLAGNLPEAPLALGAVLVDGTAPAITALAASRDRLSAVEGFSSCELTFAVDDAAATIEVTVDGRPLACAAPGRCTYAPGADEPEGLRAVVVAARDEAGNVSLAQSFLTIDHTPPGVIAATATLVPGPASLLASVTSLGPGACADVAFTSSEPLAATPALIASGGPTPTIATAGAPASGSFAVRVCAAPPGEDGGLRLEARLVDRAGNAAVVPLPGVALSFDAQPPARPATDGAETKIVLQRFPWGAEQTQGRPLLQVVGAAASVEPDALVQVLDADGVELGRVRAAADGSFPALGLSGGDREVVRVAAIDGAGNASPVAEVRDGEWIATMGSKVAGSPYENPHRLELRREHTLEVDDGRAAELGAEAGVDREGGAFATLQAGAGRFRRLSPARPLGRTLASMVYDAARGKLVLYGGIVGEDALSSLWEWSGDRWSEVPSLDPEADGDPTPRGGAAAAEDPIGQGLVVFGGVTGTSLRGVFLDDLWRWNGTSWRRIVPTDPEGDGAPGPRLLGSLAFDEARGRLVLFGGASGANVGAMVALGDTWEWDGASWRDVTPALPADSPPARFGGALAFDPGRGRMVLFGGVHQDDPAGGGDFVFDDDLWEWDGTRWSELQPPAPRPPASMASFANDRPGGNLLLWSSSTNGIDGSLWRWDGFGQSWSAVPLDPAWPIPTDDGVGTLAIDGRSNTPVLFGSEPWRLEDDRLVAHGGLGLSPPARASSAAAYDGAIDRTVLFGGDGADGWVWLWDGRAWTQSGVSATPRVGHVAVADADGAGVTFVCGGAPDPDGLLLQWDGADLLPLGPFVDAPVPAPGRRAARGPNGSLVVYGGLVAGAYDEQTYLFDGATWQALAAPGPAGRSEPALAYDARRDVTVLFGGEIPGGWGGAQLAGDVWEWDGATWSEVIPNDPEGDLGPTARRASAFAFDPERGTLVLHGGELSSVANPVATDDTWEWDGGSWRRLVRSGSADGSTPSPRARHALAPSPGGGLVIFGGSDGADDAADTWLLTTGARAKPSIVFHVLTAAARLPAGTTIRSISTRVAGGGSTLAEGAPADGVEVHVWHHGGWLPAFAWSASADAPGAVDASSEDPAVIAGFLRSPRESIHLALVPAGEGAGAASRVSLDYIELRLGYRRP